MGTYEISQWILFFFFYSFIGWIWECCYVSARQRRWVNRGFLHGPMLPLYGSGAVAVLLVTIPVRDSLPLVFLVGMIAATTLEFVTGMAMESLFHVKYWDYSNMKLNIKGHICVVASLCWGCFSVILVKVAHVPVENLILRIPLEYANPMVLVLCVVAAIDFTQSFNEAMDMKAILSQLEESKKQIQKLQDKLKVAVEEAMEDYREYSERKTSEKQSRRTAYLERVEQTRSDRKMQLSNLLDRVESLIKEEIPAKVDNLIGDDRMKELTAMKDTIMQEIQKLGSRTDRSYLRVQRHLRRNPTAVSERFRDALEELRKNIDGE